MLLHTYACCARPLHVCDRQKEKGSDKSDIDALPQLPISTGVPRLPWSVQLDRSRSPRSAIKSRVLQIHAYATRGLGFLVRCATISRQLGQGRLRSGGSPLFMINHMLLAVLTVTPSVRKCPTICCKIFVNQRLRGICCCQRKCIQVCRLI